MRSTPRKMRRAARAHLLARLDVLIACHRGLRTAPPRPPSAVEVAQLNAALKPHGARLAWDKRAAPPNMRTGR
jgi:hypothetical protein